jgi:hypothetical protein
LGFGHDDARSFMGGSGLKAQGSRLKAQGSRHGASVALESTCARAFVPAETVS